MLAPLAVNVVDEPLHTPTFAPVIPGAAFTTIVFVAVTVAHAVVAV